MSTEPRWGIPSDHMTTIVAHTGLDSLYYHWVNTKADWAPLARSTYEVDSLRSSNGGFAPIELPEIVKAFHGEGVEATRVRRTNEFTVAVSVGDCGVTLDCKRGRGFNAIEIVVSVAVSGTVREQKLSLHELARTMYLSNNPGGEDPLYPRIIFSSRSQLEVVSRELVQWMRSIATGYPT